MRGGRAWIKKTRYYCGDYEQQAEATEDDFIKQRPIKPYLTFTCIVSASLIGLLVLVNLVAHFRMPLAIFIFISFLFVVVGLPLLPIRLRGKKGLDIRKDKKGLP